MLDELILWIVVVGVLLLVGRPIVRRLRKGSAPCGAETVEGRSPCESCGLALNVDPDRLKCRTGVHRPIKDVNDEDGTGPKADID